jgi:predicted kinase
LARALGERLATPVINSDTVRKTIAGKLGRHIVSFNEGIYSANMTEKTYAKLAREAEKQLLEGRGAILDATFGQRKHREMIVRLAEKHKIPLLFIHCSVSEEITQQRLNRRMLEGKDLSDGRWEIYAGQKAAYQPIEEVSPGSCLELNTAASVEELAQRSERFLRSRLKPK